MRTWAHGVTEIWDHGATGILGLWGHGDCGIMGSWRRAVLTSKILPSAFAAAVSPAWDDALRRLSTPLVQEESVASQLPGATPNISGHVVAERE
ncbi:hypothetical protein chiPu_0012702 [Chiloscyllium punctatum]|uniref:Uncharacterized protein n=1 Tax=Chiloscyllium punctatum TaxID=137246 RepID=A0A401SV08_CHIPU|nr:hypothetical protein [Chiloscyllium punctatum]